MFFGPNDQPTFVTVTGEVLKCIVIVDTLHRIEIETTTRLLYLEDSPEEMIVRGYDLEGRILYSIYKCTGNEIFSHNCFAGAFLAHLNT